LGPDRVLDAHSDLAVYECDAFVIEKHCPSVAVFPQTAAEVAAIVRLCNENAVPFVPRGAGTSLSGGGMPVGGGVMIVLTRMREIPEVNLRDRYAIVEPGVVNAALNKHLAGTGYHYAPDPSSQGACTIGGNTATNAGGPHTLKYGVTVNHVLGLELVTADGEIVRLGGPAEDSPGPDLVGTIVGGEGTLGTVEEAFQFGFPLDAEAVLIIEVDGLEIGLDAQRDRITEICTQNNAREVRFAADPKQRLQLWKARKQAFGAIGRLSPSYCTQDGVVPRTKLPHILHRIREIGAKHDVRIVNVFHAGDGNLHPILLFDERHPEEIQRVLAASEEILLECIACGGSVTGEHGIGLEKLNLMHRMFTEHDLDVMTRLRDALNTTGLLSPGKLLPTAGACGMEQVRPGRRAAL
jgi:glycolate oxidase